MASVRLERVTKRFGAASAVDDISLEVPDKEFLVLVGPSGCGKSTLLRMLAGLERVSEGRIYIGDRLVNEVPAKDRDIAMVFQSYALYPHMSVYENLAFGLSLRKMAKAEIRSRVNTAADILEITDLLERRPRALSGGQRQRVALGRAIVREPAAFLMDEPLSNLDAKLRVQMRAELIRLHERLKTTFIYVTHDQVEAMTMGNRIAVLNFGVLQQLDTPQNLYRNPANLFVAGFIGSPSMNFFDGEIVQSDGHPACRVDDFVLRVDPAREAALGTHLGAQVVFGIRPEHISDGRPAGSAEQNAVRSKIDVVEHLGNEMLVYFLPVGRSEKLTFIARMSGERQARPGDELDIYFDAARAHVFDRETGRAIA
jgi:multiple sugar transport system ATP-binding protein